MKGRIAFNLRRFILLNSEGIPIGMDRDSGGYPFVASHPAQVRWWNSKEEAADYASHWPGKYEIAESYLTIEVEDERRFVGAP